MTPLRQMTKLVPPRGEAGFSRHRRLLRWLGMLVSLTAVAWCEVPTTARFDLSVVPRPLVVEKSLHERWRVMQSFAFDPRNGEIYAVQVAGAAAGEAKINHDHAGDLTLSRLTADGSAVLGHMTLLGFGHGVAIGVEPTESGVCLWTEVDSQPTPTGSGRGSRLARFAFANGTRLEAGSAAVAKYTVVQGAVNVTPSVDFVHGRLAVRYVVAGHFEVALYRLSDVKTGLREPLARCLCPTDLGTFQGWATWGSFLYFYAGNNYSEENPPPGNAVLSCYDWNTGREVQRVRTEAFREQTWREPEGLAIQINRDQPALVFGFASRAAGTNQRVISLAAIDKTVR